MIDIGLELTTPPYSSYVINWDVTGLSGIYNIRAMATDTSDNVVYSDTIDEGEIRKIKSEIKRLYLK